MVARETYRSARWIQEAIWIRKTVPTIMSTNRDEGGYRLSDVWDSLLTSSDNSVLEEGC